MRIGYARASTVRQSLDTQTDSLKASGVTRVFAEKISTRAVTRPELDKAVALAREIRASGAAVTIVVHEHKRLGRGIELAALAEQLRAAAGISLEFLTGEMRMADPRGIRTRVEWTVALQALFAQAGVSYDVLVERCRKSSSISKSTLQQMVTGESFPRPSTVKLFVQACGEHDAQPWIDVRVRVAAADVSLKRHRTPPGQQVRIGAVPRSVDCFQEREVADRLEGAAEPPLVIPVELAEPMTQAGFL